MRLGSLSVVTVLWSLASCQGRDPAISLMNEEALGGEGEGEGEVRQLDTQAMFGTLPLENRFMDPLLSFADSYFAWMAIAIGFPAPAHLYARVIETPTRTGALELSGRLLNPNGVFLIGQYKSARAPHTVSVWIGRARSSDALDDVRASVLGLYMDGREAGVDLAFEPDTEQRFGDRIWTRMSVTLDEGPIGWGSLFIESLRDDATFVAGPLALDVEPGPADARARVAVRRALDLRERTALQIVHERSRDLMSRPSVHSTR
jgi:hypothetical protein